VPRVAILTASDKGAAGARQDASGDLIAERCAAAGHSITSRTVVSDDRATIARTLREWADANVADVIITTGGTGLTPRDVTPEATRDVAERDVPGIPIALAIAGLQNTPYAALTRGIAVTRGQTLIVNLPGSPKAVAEGLDVLLPLLGHIADLLAGPHEHTPNEVPVNPKSAMPNPKS
jgi:molybdenum cofactor synthesis domain-containing protein